MMKRSRVLLAATALVLVLTGCGATETPATAPSAKPTSAAPTTSTADVDRDACHALSAGPDFATWQDALALAEIADLAAHAPNPGISTAGDAMAETVGKVKAGELESARANLALARAQLDLAEACGHRFGDGPW